MRIFLAILVKAITKNSDCLRFLTVKTRLSSRIIESRSRYVTFPWEQNVLIATNRGPVNMAKKSKTLTCMAILWMIALRSKAIAQTFLPSFDNANSRLCQERLLRSRNLTTMLTWRHTSPLYKMSHFEQNQNLIKVTSLSEIAVLKCLTLPFFFI